MSEEQTSERCRAGYSDVLNGTFLKLGFVILEVLVIRIIVCPPHIDRFVGKNRLVCQRFFRKFLDTMSTTSFHRTRTRATTKPTNSHTLSTGQGRGTNELYRGSAFSVRDENHASISNDPHVDDRPKHLEGFANPLLGVNSAGSNTRNVERYRHQSPSRLQIDGTY